MDNCIIATFRRERTYLEFQAAQEGLGKPAPERFVKMGSIAMCQVPDVGKYIFLNGISYIVRDQTWSVYLPEDENQPNFHDPEVLITLSQANDHANGFAPTEDFQL